MTEVGWTSKKPIVAGWYWWRFDASASATIVRIMVCGDGSLAEMSNNGHLLLAANFGGEWLGPLSPNDYQQGRVAGLREAEKYALRCLKELQDKIRDLESGKCVLAGAQTKEGVEAWVHAKTLEASRIAKWITARIIEQQAQEGGVGDAEN